MKEEDAPKVQGTNGLRMLQQALVAATDNSPDKQLVKCSSNGPNRGKECEKLCDFAPNKPRQPEFVHCCQRSVSGAVFPGLDLRKGSQST